MHTIRNLLLLAATLAIPCTTRGDDPGTLPTDVHGRPLNLDFEDGTLADWKAEGDAFKGQPIEGDTVHARRTDMASHHAGRFWIGTFERQGDAPQGTLTSVPFKVSKPFASFLVAGGSQPETAVELVRADSGKVIAQSSGDGTETLQRVAVDLSPHLGHEIVIRLVDRRSDGWGHLNFDDFRLHDQKPPFPERLGPGLVDTSTGLSPLEAAKAMTLPKGFKATLFAGEPDVVQPIAFAIDDRGRLWVAEAYSYPKRLPNDKAHDAILIFEDNDGDGHFDRRTVFADKLNLVSGLEIGFGGVWVGASPQFLFIPDQDGDDKPDGPPQVLLDGFGQEDTHETLNSFNWGPDGWLYGCHGVFTFSRVGKPGTPDDQRIPINAGIWRYHPTKHIFEVFAHGTSNPWGVDFDEHGQAFETACVIPHLYHMIQGGRYQRQAGAHDNPYTFDDIKTIADHRHYAGDIREHAWWGHAPLPNKATLDAGGGHAHAGAMIYLGGSWPKEYRGSLFMNNIHGARINRDTLQPKGSGFIGHHAPDFLLANDTWSQIVSLKYGPDGNVFMIDWYDKNQCHRVEDVHDRTNGRIFKISYGNRKPAAVDLAKADDDALIGYLSNPNDWWSRHARRVLQERGAKPKVREELAALTFDQFRIPAVIGGSNLGGAPDRSITLKYAPENVRLRALWALHSAGGLDEEHIAKGLASDSPYVRAWTIQLAMEDKNPSSATLAKFAGLAKSDPSPVVRLYLASALQRMPPEKRWEIVAALIRHGEDADDHNLPLMYWYAAEPLAEVDLQRAWKLANDSKIPMIRSFMARRIGAIGTPDAIALLVDQVGHTDRSDERLRLLDGLAEGLKGRRAVKMPAAWPKVFETIARDHDPKVRARATALGVTFGDPAALATLRTILDDRKASLESRREALAALLKVRDPKLATTLRGLLDDADLRGQALRGLAVFDDPETPKAILKVYRDLKPAERRDALNTLAARVGFARELLAAVGRKEIATTDLSADLVRQLRNLKDESLNEQIGRVWGTARESTGDKAKLIARFKAMLQKPTPIPPDPSLGRAVFAKTCQQCHTLFGTGAAVGPELTGSNRADLDYILSNVLDPSALIGKDYVAHVVATADGRALTGIIKSEDKDSITLVTANETLTIPREDIEEQKPSEQSMMPEDLLTPLSEREVRSLIAYLASPAQTAMLATAENAPGLFNGKDLSGWQGNPKMWRVENGEIIGRVDRPKQEDWLASDLVAQDFRLSCQVKVDGPKGRGLIRLRETARDGRGAVVAIGPDGGSLSFESGGGHADEAQRGGLGRLRPDQWNTLEFEGRGRDLVVRINGQEFDGPNLNRGHARYAIALGLGAGGPAEIHVKDLKLELGSGKGQ